MIDRNSADTLFDADVHGSDDRKIGSVGQVYIDDNTQTPVWVTVKTGIFGTSETFVPLKQATFDDGTLRVPFTREFVKDAPRIDVDGSLQETEEDALYRYYGKGASPERTTADHTTAGVFDQDSDRSIRGEGHDTSGPNTDEAMTRSEERLRVGTETVETGRARLRKHIVTETVTKTVPVSRQEVTLEREPITDANRDAALSGGELTEEEHEVVLTEERVVVAKETVPVERVALGTETITENREVTEEVAHEEIEVVGADGNRTRSTDGRNDDRQEHPRRTDGI